MPATCSPLNMADLTAAQRETIATLEAQHGRTYWRTACQFVGPLTTGVSLCIGGAGFIVTASGRAVPA